MRIGWIGVGVMGSAMVNRLIENGHSLTLFNRTPEKLKPFEKKATLTHDLREVIKNQDVIITMVGFPSDVESVYQTMLPFVDQNTLLIDMTTSSPTLAKRLYQQAQALGISLLDAPVTGGDIGAQKGTLTIMVGGQEKDFQKAKSIFEILGKTIVYMGETGSGMTAKLANQIAIAGALGGLAESLHFAENHHLNLSFMLSILNSGSAQSFQSQNNGPKMLDHHFQPGFYIKHFQKDLGLALESSELKKMPITQQVKKLYDWMVDHGYQDLGTQAVIEYFRFQSSSK